MYKTLRPFQHENVQDIRNAIKQGYKAILNVLPCGAGKSVIQAEIARLATIKGKRILFIVHRKELLEQIKDTFFEQRVCFLHCRFYLIQSVSRFDEFNPDIILIDEAHNARAESYVKLFERFPQAVKIGFTATPKRLGKKKLGDIFDEIIVGVSAKWLIDNNYLAPYRMFSLPSADLSNISVRNGEYDQGALALLMEDEQIYKDTVNLYNQHLQGKKTIIYCVSVKAAKMTANCFIQSKIRAADISCYTPKRERHAKLEAFRRGEIEVLTNFYLFGEGIDVVDCQAVIDLAKTKSLARYLQKTMRCMRYQPDKTAIIIDCVGNSLEHGLPDSERKWSLTETRKTEKGDAPVKVCPKCNTVNYLIAKKCVSCDFEFELTEKESIDISAVVEVDLERIRRILDAPYNQYTKIKTWEELTEFRKIRGYKFFWAIFKAIELGLDIPPKYQKYISIANKKTAG